MKGQTGERKVCTIKRILFGNASKLTEVLEDVTPTQLFRDKSVSDHAKPAVDIQNDHSS